MYCPFSGRGSIRDFFDNIRDLPLGGRFLLRQPGEVQLCASANMQDLPLDGLKVIEGFGPFGRVPQQGGGVVDCGRADTVAVEPEPMLLCNAELVADEPQGGNAAKTDKDFWPDEVNLAEKVADTGILLHVQRVAVARRAALDHIGNVYLGSVQADHGQHIVQQLAGLSHEGDALLVLVCPWPLTHQHEFGLGVPHAEDDVLPCLA